MDIGWPAVIKTVGEEARGYGRTWGAGPVMCPWLEDGGLWAAVPGGSRWMWVYVRAKRGGVDAWCKCRKPGYCQHSIEVMAYAADNAGRLKAARAAEDDGVRQAAKDASPECKDLIPRDPGSGGVGRERLHLLRLGSSGLPPRGLDYGRMLDRMYMDASTKCYLEDMVDVDFGQATRVARKFASRGDAAEASRIYESVAETVAKNIGITDDSNAHYCTSLQVALNDLVKCMKKRGMPQDARNSRISWLAGRVARDDPDFFTEDFAKALDSACVSEKDAAWRSRPRPNYALSGRQRR